MRAFSLSLTLCIFLSVSQSIPTNITEASRRSGLCAYAYQQSVGNIHTFIPECDIYGDFLPQQCSQSTGYCWCVDVITGEEIPKTKTALGSVPIDCERAFLCPHGWSRFGNQCFVFIKDRKSWFQAESYCMFEMANLASVHSAEEDHFIQSLTRGDGHDFPSTWIGGHDTVQSGFWMWSDGSKFTYENWAKDYNVERNDHCLIMNYGFHNEWNYSSCEYSNPFVCAKRI